MERYEVIDAYGKYTLCSFASEDEATDFAVSYADTYGTDALVEDDDGAIIFDTRN